MIWLKMGVRRNRKSWSSVEKKNMPDVMLENNKHLRFWFEVSEKLKYFHPFPTISMYQEDNRRQGEFNSYANSKKVKQADGSNLFVHAGIKRKKLFPEVFGKHVQQTLYKDCEFWYQRKHDVHSLEIFLSARSGHRLSYAIYLMNQFIEGFRVVPLLVDWAEQCFVDLSFSFSQYIGPDGFGLRIPSLDYLEEMNIKGIKRFTLIEYMPRTRICLCCGKYYDASKGRKELVSPSNGLILDH